MQDDARFIRRGTALNTIGLVARNVSPVLVILLARVFPPGDFGLYISLQLFTLTASKLIVLGLDKGLCWYVPQNEKHGRPPHHGVASATRRSLLTALLSLLGAGLLLETGLHTYAGGLADSDPRFVLGCLASLPAYALLHVHAGALEGLRRPEYRILLNQSLVTALAPLLALLLHALGVGSLALPAGFTLANTAGAAVIVFAARRHFPALRYTDRETLPPELWRYSWPLGLSEALSGVLLRVDLWMILTLLGPKPAGVYAIMTMLSNGVRSIRQGYDSLVVPIVSGMEANRRSRELREVYSYAVHMVTMIQLAVAYAVLLFPAEILLIAGEEYVVQPLTLAVLLMGNLAAGFLGLSGQVLLGLGHSRAVLLSGIIALGANIAGNVALIPSLGIVGAATASVIALLLQGILMLSMQRWLLGQWLYETHLLVNGALIVVFVTTTALAQTQLAALALWQRIASYALCLAVLALVMWLKRHTLRERPSRG